MNAVDAAGVHPLLLAVGSERYMPFLNEPRPQEILTQANAILGQGQLSLAKFLWIADAHSWNEKSEALHDLHAIRPFFEHMLRRADWTRDLHFHTQTTIDTLDYSGNGLNAGSKLVVAATGQPKFDLATDTSNITSLPDGFSEPRVVMPGVLAVRGPSLPKPSFDYDAAARGEKSGQQIESEGIQEASLGARADIDRFCRLIDLADPICRFRMIVISDDPSFLATESGHEGIGNFLWATFTRANPASDVWGIGAFNMQKHWGCRGPLVIDARVKPHHAPILEEDPQVSDKIEALASNGGPLSGLF